MPLLFYCRHLWSSPVGWAFPHGSHKQRTHCLVSVFSRPPSASMLCVVVRLVCFVTLHASLSSVYSDGAVLARLLSMSKPISAMYFNFFSPFIAFVKRSAGLLVVPTFFTVSLPSFTSCCIQRYWTSICLVFPRPWRCAMPMAADASEHHSSYHLFAKIRHHGDEPFGLGCSFEHTVELGLAARERHDLLS